MNGFHDKFYFYVAETEPIKLNKSKELINK